MIRLQKTLLAILIGALSVAPFLVLTPQDKAKAAATVLCSPEIPGSAMARVVGGSTSPVPSGTLYSLNGQGCAVIAQQDVAYFISQGFTAGPPFGQSLLFTTGVWTGTTSFQVGSIPAASYIQHIIFSNSTANAVTGNIAVGTTSGAADVVTAQACGANCLVFVSDATLLKRVFSVTAPQALFITPVTSGNNANVTATVVWGFF
jgi:hypothetical protein